MTRIAARKGTIRPVAAGHTSSELLETADTLVSLENFQGLEFFDLDRQEAVVRAGTTIKEAGRLLLEVGLAMHNQGDVNVQTLVGAMSTGTHGTGRDLKNLSAAMVGGRMVTADGTIKEFSLQDDPDFVNAAQLSLGALGILTAVKVKLLPAYRLHRREYCASIDACLEHLDDLINENRNFDFYWYPRCDEVKLRTNNLVEKDPGPLPYARVVRDEVGWSYNILSRVRDLRFDEMEYLVPAEKGLECFLEIRDVIKRKHRKYVGWRTLYRTIAEDDVFLSPAYGRPTVAISLHQNNTLPFWEYFKDMEPVFLRYGGRPHWAKKHTLRAEDLRGMYPRWDRFNSYREGLDPEGLFLSPYLSRLLIGGGQV